MKGVNSEGGRDVVWELREREGGRSGIKGKRERERQQCEEGSELQFDFV